VPKVVAKKPSVAKVTKAAKPIGTEKKTVKHVKLTAAQKLTISEREHEKNVKALKALPNKFKSKIDQEIELKTAYEHGFKSISAFKKSVSKHGGVNGAKSSAEADLIGGQVDPYRKWMDEVVVDH
jgi:delta-aminolevulinic acid dehydratase/porphobilinogen synthase